MEASQHRTISPEVFRAFREAKDTFFDLVAQQQMLPKEYETCLQHVHETIDEIQHYETQCSSMSEITTIGYITAVLVFDINHCLQNLHDIAENRVIRGSHLTEAEINFIVEITDLYNFFLLELFPSLGLNPIESLVDLTPVATAQAASRPRQLNKVTLTTAKRIILGGGDPNSPELQALALTKSNLTRVAQMMRPHNEVLIRHGMVVKTRKLTKKLRYLFLTNLRLIYMENLDTFKGSIEVASIISVKAQKNTFHVVTKGRTYLFHSLEAEAWEKDIMASVQFFQSLRDMGALPVASSEGAGAPGDDAKGSVAASVGPSGAAQPPPLAAAEAATLAATSDLSPDFILPGIDLSKFASLNTSATAAVGGTGSPPVSLLGHSPERRESLSPGSGRHEGGTSVTGQATALSSSFSASDALSLSPGCAACSPPPLPCVLAPPAATDPGAASTGQPQLQPHVTSSLHAPGGERGGENSEGEDGRWAGPASSLVAGAFAAQQQQLFSQQPLQLQQQGKDSVAAAVAAAASEPVDSLPSYDIVVEIGRAENLLVNKKGRADNPYCFLGIGSPLHYAPRRVPRVRTRILENTRNPTFNETFVFRYTPDQEPFLDIRLYSRTSSTVNNFSYGSVRISLQEVFMSSTHELEGWWDIGAQEGRIHGRMHVRVAVRDYPLFKVPDPVPFPVPALVMHRSFELREKVPLVFADGHEIVGTLRGDPSIGVQLIDVASRRMIYALRKNSFLKKEYLVVDAANEVFGRCYHKLKTIRKKKIRLVLSSDEYLLSMEGNYSNEVSITDFMGRSVASLVVGEGAYNRTVERVLVLTVTHPNADAALLVLFALYVMYTL